MKKVSIIIPVYNSENYISDCLESILVQTYQNIEVIVVDDGSIDDSVNKCKEIQKNDNRVMIIKKKNGGVSSARNTGLKKSSGDYIIFVDSDDIIPANFVAEMVKAVSGNAEMAVCGILEKTKKDVKKAVYSGNINVKDFRFLMYAHNSIGGFCCNKIYSSEIIKKNGIKFNEKIKNYEDMLFNIQYVSCVDNIKYTKSTSYIYIQRKGSAAKANDRDVYDEISKAVSEMRSFSDDNLKNLLALDYILLEESIRTGHKWDKKIFRSFVFDKDLSFSRRMKVFLKATCHPVYKLYVFVKRRGYYEN